ncbi:MAG: DUF2723 domain-containing protein [Nitrospirota bacterium]
MIPAFVFAVSMLLYLMTIAPTLSFFDSGEMISGAYTLGVSHPPGYPVYVTLGKLFTFIPLGNVAFRVNLMSAFFATMTSVMIYYITRAMFQDPEAPGDKKKTEGFFKSVVNPAEIAGIFSALAFSFSYNVWAWAVVSKFYTLNAFVVSCLLMLLIRWRRARIEEGDRGGGHSLAYLYAIAFLLGIAPVVHISQFVLIPMYLLYIVIVDGRVFLDIRSGKGQSFLRRVLSIIKTVNLKTIVLGGFFFLLGHSIYLHLPLRAVQDPLIDWGIPTTWGQFKWDYNREGYPVVGGIRTWSLLWEQIKSFNLVREFTWAGIPLILLGLWGHLKRDWRHFTVLAFGSVWMTSIIVIMGNPPIENIFLLEQFYIPVYIFLTIIMGGAVYLILDNSRLGPWILALTLPFMFLGEMPLGYLNALVTGNRPATFMTYLGIRYPTPLYFLFYAVLAAAILAALRFIIRNKRPGNAWIYVWVFMLLFVLYPAYQVKAHYWKNDRSNNFIAYDMGTAELNNAPEFSVLFTWGDSGAFPMWYMQDVEQKRPDVLLVHTPHLPLEWFLQSIRRSGSELGDKTQIADNYNLLRNYNGLKGIEQLLSVPEDFRDPAQMIQEIMRLNPDRKFLFDYSSRYSITMPYDVLPYGITYRPMEDRYAEKNLRIWRYLVTRGLPDPVIALDLDETKAVNIYGYVHADIGRKYMQMGLRPLARQEFEQAVRYSPDLAESLMPYMQ